MILRRVALAGFQTSLITTSLLFSSSLLSPSVVTAFGRLMSTGQQQQQHSSSSTTTALHGNSRHVNDDATIQRALTESKVIALIGASHKPSRPAYYVMEYLLDLGYDVIPINPGLDGQKLLGQTVYSSLSNIPTDRRQQIDMIDIFRNSATVEPIIDEVLALDAPNNIQTVWMQVGVVNDVAAQKAKDAGLNVVMNACPKMEIPRFGLSGPGPISEL